MYNRIQDEKEKWMQPLLSLNLQPQSSPNHLFTPHEEAKPNRHKIQRKELHLNINKYECAKINNSERTEGDM